MEEKRLDVRVEHIPAHKYLGIPCEYAGEIPDGFSVKEIPAVEKLAWGFGPKEMGYEWNEEACPIYQRHYPGKLGYQVLRPVRKSK